MLGRALVRSLLDVETLPTVLVKSRHSEQPDTRPLPSPGSPSRVGPSTRSDRREPAWVRDDPDNPADANFSAAAYLRASVAARGSARRDLRLQPRRLVRRGGSGDGPNLRHQPADERARGRRRYLQPRLGRYRGRRHIAPGRQPSRPPARPGDRRFLQHIAALLGRELVTTGTNHSRYTVEGRVSDHRRRAGRPRHCRAAAGRGIARAGATPSYGDRHAARR
jgi:hypothetical protein